MSEERIQAIVNEAVEVLRAIDAAQVKAIRSAADAIVKALRRDRRVYILGNGGSAADAQHFAAELVGRFRMDRKALPVTALTTDTSILTSIGNDYGYQCIFSKQVEGFVHRGDVVVCISTSGNSPNVVAAMMIARELGATTIGLAGHDGGKMKSLCDVLVSVPAESTARAQEAHGVVIHAICELVEGEIFSPQRRGKTGKASNGR
ncbi:MAG: D-sedoheptulose 7-phosphate isomerase [Planctomycetota bacterium]